MRYHGLNNDGEILSSMYVDRSEKDRTHPSVVLDCSCEQSLTRTEFQDECDINKLMERYEKTGVISHINPHTPQYLDLSDVPDLMEAHAILDRAQREFMALPANVRREFDNDPLAFIAFAERPENIGRMREWGLAPPEAAPASDAPPKAAASDAGAEAPAPSAK